MKYHKIKYFASQMRKNPTSEERILWKYIRKRQLCGRKFIRQHPIKYDSKGNDHSFFIPDFYCASERLIIEVDGPIHDYQKEKDSRREEILKSKGFTILRFKNSELKDINKVLSKIAEAFT